LGLKFSDSRTERIVQRFPLPVVKDANSENCLIDMGDRNQIQPEEILALHFHELKNAVMRQTGELVSDITIGVPTLFTSAQREALRDAGIRAGLNIVHITSGALLAARAVRKAGGLQESGQAVIIYFGTSSIELSLVRVTSEMIREVRTVGSDRMGTDDMRDRIVDRYLPMLEQMGNMNDRYVRARLTQAVNLALEAEDEPLIVLDDLETPFRVSLDESDFADACGDGIAVIRDLISELFPYEEEKTTVNSVPYLTGAGPYGFSPIEAAIQLEFPNAELSRVAADSAIACGATLDCAQVTDRLPPAMHEAVKGVVPYTIGVEFIGEVVHFVVPRGETLPAVGETSLFTTIDSQDSMEVKIYQGEHRLCEHSDLIGTTLFTDLPPLPRRECQAACRIEYGESGILQFSASEARTGKTITTSFRARTEFTEDDHTRLIQASRMSQVEEEHHSNLRYVREVFGLDIERAEAQNGGTDFAETTRKWRKWWNINTSGDARLFELQRHEALMEFHQLNPDLWDDPGDPPSDVQFRPISPTGSLFTDEGAGIIRFVTAIDYSDVDLSITNIETRETSTCFEMCQFSNGERIETIIRISFPKNGKYLVNAFAGKVGATTLDELCDVIYEKTCWRFDVHGAPPQRRPLCTLINGRTFLPLNSTNTLQVEPKESCVKIPDCVYHFSCKYRGDELLINGREFDGEPEQVLHPEIEEMSMEGDWRIMRCTLVFPISGVWRVMFWVDDKQTAIQLVVAGMTKQKLTMEEKIALLAK
jgi:molecular chaperone DnaK (HSP70)